VRRFIGRVAAGALALAAFGGGTAQAAGPAGTLGPDGRTAPLFDYQAAIRERVFIPQPGIDQDGNHQTDWITADVIRPRESGVDNRMPAIVDPSPYYTTVCRGNEGQCMADWDGDGVNDRWPLFYDNYFVPRGYAYILGQMNGTGYTTSGCPMHGGPGDIAGEKSIVDWLNGRVPGYVMADLASSPKVASWHNGSSAMIGKSYDGTLSNGVAATGVEGLKTIVPISAISAWYLYSRTGGIRNNNDYPGRILNPTVTTAGGAQNPPGVNLPGRRAICEPANADISNEANVDTGDGDVHGDINSFWRERDYVKDVGKVKAAVFATHGFQDDNVRMDHEWLWWNGLKANDVPRKLWLMRTGHTDPFESRRAVWVDTLHRWLDHYLYDVRNGIEQEPAVTIEDEANVWKDYVDWPVPGTRNVDVFLRGSTEVAAGTLGGTSGGAARTLSFTGTADYPAESAVIGAPDGSQASRRVFLSRPLTKDVRVSGAPTIDIQATLGTTQSNLGAVIVDYGAGMQVSRGNGGIANTKNRTCWGETSAGGPACTIGEPCTPSAREIDTACYLEVTKPTLAVTQWRVTRGTLDSSNRNSLWYRDASPLTLGDKGRFTFPAFATEHIFKAGHRIGIVIVGNLFGGDAGTGLATSAGPAQPITLDTKASKVVLPIQGGYSAFASAGATDAETVAPVLGDDVPAEIAAETANADGTAVAFTPPTATDDEDPNPAVTCDPASGATFPIGATTVSCVARDANGNASAPKTFTVVVRRLVPVDSTVGGSPPAALSLTLGTPASFGAFTPGIGRDYAAQTTAAVASSAAAAALTVADPSATAPGHLVDGAFSLPSGLQANAGGPFAGIGGPAAPTLLKRWAAPASRDVVTIAFKQTIGAGVALRTGTYAKTLTFTLSTTTP
jgi:X-Pro dipeptidyl-peptidase